MRALKLLFASERFVTNMIISGAILGVIVVSLVILRFDIARRADTIRSSRNTIALRSQSLEIFSLLKSQSAEAAGYETLLKQKLPPKDTLITFPQTVETIANAHRVEASFAFNAETPPANGLPGSIAFTLVLSGGYDDIVLFLDDLEKTSAIVVFDTFDLAQAQTSFRGTFQGRVFYQQ